MNGCERIHSGGALALAPQGGASCAGADSRLDLLDEILDRVGCLSNKASCEDPLLVPVLVVSIAMDAIVSEVHEPKHEFLVSHQVERPYSSLSMASSVRYSSRKATYSSSNTRAYRKSWTQYSIVSVHRPVESAQSWYIAGVD
jgi:hypothetical protein